MKHLAFKKLIPSFALGLIVLGCLWVIAQSSDDGSPLTIQTDRFTAVQHIQQVHLNQKQGERVVERIGIMNSGGNTLGIGKIDPKTNRVAPLANTTNAGSSVIAGKGNTNTALQGSLIIGGENNTLSASSNATSNSIIFGGKSNTASANNSAVLVSSGVTLGADAEGSVAIAVRNANIQGANTAAYVGENIQVTPSAKESLVLGSNVTLDKEGVFVFNMKSNPFQPQKEHTFLINADYGMIVGTNTSANGLVQLTVAGALRVGEETCSSEKQGAIFKKEGCICGCAENGQGQALLTDPDCVTICGGNITPPAPQPSYSCTGPVPANATLINGDDQGLTRDTSRRLVASNTSAKCEYVCDSNYTLQNGRCVRQPRIDGVCGVRLNQCTAGSYLYDGESEDYYFWKCRGLYGGSTIRCKSQKQTTPTPPVINGVCDQDNLNICKSGTFQEIEDTDTEYLWNCLGQNGGKKSECKIKKNVWSCTSDVAYSCQRQTLTGTLEKKAGVAVLPFEGGKQWTCAQDVVCTMCNANYQANTSTNPAKCVKQQHQVEQVRACFYPAKGIVGISGRNFTYTCVQSSNQKCIKYDKGTVLNLKNYWNSDFGQKSNKFVGWAKENPYGQNQGGSLSAGNNNFVLNTYTLNTNTKFCGVYDNYECVGTLPSYAEWASGEEQVDLIEDTNISPVENNTNNPNKKCEYKCKPGYQLNGNLCSKIPEQPKRCGYIPTNAEFYLGDDQNLSANTESVYAASNTSRKCEWRCKDRYELLENNGQQFCPAKFECLVNEKAIGSSYYQSLCSGYKNKFACEREYWDGSGRGRCDPSREESQRPHTCRTSYPRHQRDLENSDIPPLCTLIPNSGFENIWCEVPTLCKWARWDGLDVPTNHYLP